MLHFPVFVKPSSGNYCITFSKTVCVLQCCCKMYTIPFLFNLYRVDDTEGRNKYFIRNCNIIVNLKKRVYFTFESNIAKSI